MMFFNKRVLRTLIYIITGLITVIIITIALKSPERATSFIPKILNSNTEIQAEDPDVLINIGFKKCTAFAFFEKCNDGITRFENELKELTNNNIELINSIKINKLDKDLNAGISTFTTIIPYEIKISYDLAKKFKIPVIENFYIHNKIDDDKIIKNTKIPSEILIETKNITNIKELNNLGYYNVGYGIWYKSSISYSKAFTNINYLFNAHFDNIIPGWSLISKRPVNIHKNDDKSIGHLDRDIKKFESINFHKFDTEVYLYAKIKKSLSYPKINLTTKKDGTFKITQLADLHLSTGFGKCRDIYPKIDYPEKNCLADELTLDFVDYILNIEEPDLVVLTGDQIYGIDCFDSETALLKILSLIIKRKIPFALVFGNHDAEEGTWNRSEMMEYISKLPYSLSIAGPEEIKGIGNYQLIINDYYNSNKPIIELIMLDSHSQFPKNSKQIGYDYFSEDQKEFVKRINENYSDNEIIKMAFFHIPLFEYRNINNFESNFYDGKFIESVMSPNINSGMFDIFKEIGIQMISVGHDHCNDFCFLNDGIELCYGGSGGFGGYGGYGGYIRRIRSFEINTITKEITTWKRLYDDPEKIVDKSTYIN